MPPQRIQLAERRERHNSPSFLLQLLHLMIAHLRVGYFVLYCFNACTKGISTFFCQADRKQFARLKNWDTFYYYFIALMLASKGIFTSFYQLILWVIETACKCIQFFQKICHCIFSFLLGCVAQKVFHFRFVKSTGDTACRMRSMRRRSPKVLYSKV